MPVTVDQLLEYVARGHAYAQHVEGLGNDSRGPRNNVNEFARDTRLPINKPEDLKDYMNRLLDSPETRGYVRNDGSVVLYNSRDNVRVIFNQARGEVDLGTTYPQTDRGASFNRELALERTSGRSSFREFDNSRTPGSVRAQVESFAQSVPANHPALTRRPGEAARADYPTSGNAQQGMSPEYRLSASTEFVRASGVESGRGYVAGTSENGLPSRMFFMDERANRVTEINNGRVTVHTFDNLPAGERTAAARQFFEINRPPQATVSEGGVRGLVREFQSHNTPGRAQLSEGVVNNAIRTDLVANNNAVRTSVAYQNSAEVAQAAERAVQAYIGFDAGQANAFNRIPPQISAADLARVQDPRVVSALRDLSVAKDLTMSSTGTERVAGLRLFAETFNNMDAGTRAGVMTALNGMNATADAARTARGLDAASDLAEVARALKAGRVASNMGKAGVITTVVLTAAAVAMTDRANAMTLDLAGQLHASGRLSNEAYRDFRQMMSEVGPMLTAQAADPFPTAIPGMAIVERIAYNRFKEFSDRHQLSQDVHEMLSPSIVAGTSLRGEIGQDTYRMIPTDPSAVPPALRALAEAKRDVEAARTDYRQTYNQHRPSPLIEGFMLAGAGAGAGVMPMTNPAHEMTISNPAVQAAQQRVDIAQSAFQREFDRALADPQGARALAGLMTTDQLLEVVKATAKFNTGQQQHPLIQNLVNAQQQGLTGIWARMTAENALRQNPQVMRDYLSNLFTPRPQIRAAAEVQNDAGSVVAVAAVDVESHAGFTAVAGAFERMKCGDTLDASEQEEVRRVLSSTDTEGQAVAEEIRARYPEQAAQFAGNDDDVPAVNPAQLPQDGVRYGGGGQQARAAAAP